jgi:hypothetical protein
MEYWRLGSGRLCYSRSRYGMGVLVAVQLGYNQCWLSELTLAYNNMTPCIFLTTDEMTYRLMFSRS